ncbi:hypothetical protein H4R34_002030, partial [Dimargaris verticillata]
MKLSTAFVLLAICAATIIAFPVDQQGSTNALVRRTPGGGGSHEKEDTSSGDDDNGEGKKDKNKNKEGEGEDEDEQSNGDKPSEKKSKKSDTNDKTTKNSKEEEEMVATPGEANESEKGKGKGVSNFNQKATYYNPSAGTGACGIHYSDSDMVAAISASEFNESKCGQEVTVNGPTGSTKVKIGDSCPGCDPSHIDLSPAANAKINSNYEFDGVTK